jgi:hypothetical protein
MIHALHWQQREGKGGKEPAGDGRLETINALICGNAPYRFQP